MIAKGAGMPGLTDALATGDFPEADVAGVVFQDEDIAGEERAVRAAEIEQHAVLPGDGDDLHFGDDWRTHCAVMDTGFRTTDQVRNEWRRSRGR